MQEKTVNEFDLIDLIVQTKDLDKLFKLKDNGAFGIALHQILVNIYDKNPNQLNEHQLNLFLSMHLENSGQSSHILSCLQEWFPEHIDKFAIALNEIGAIKSAFVIKKAVALLPKDGTWFFEKANDDSKLKMKELDGLFSSYLDGNMSNIYRDYANKHKKEIIKI